MNDTKKPVFNADAAEEYFSDLLTFYRNTANDIFRRDNDGRPASKQIYSAEYQKFLGMQAAMREVLEYFSKFDLCTPLFGRCKDCAAFEGNKCKNTGYYTPETGYCHDFSPKENEILPSVEVKP